MRLAQSINRKIDREGYQPTRRELKALKQAKAAKDAPGYQPPKAPPSVGVVPVYDNTGHCYLVSEAVADSLTGDADNYAAELATVGAK